MHMINIVLKKLYSTLKYGTVHTVNQRDVVLQYGKVLRIEFGA